jgi:hypothetical protein
MHNVNDFEVGIKYAFNTESGMKDAKSLVNESKFKFKKVSVVYA